MGGDGETVNPAEFWDDVFRNNRREWVKDRSADETIGMLSMVGPFEEELREAKVVLDVGPGEARLLRELADKNRWAIEISAVNRERLKKNGISAYPPDGFWGHSDRRVNLAWSISCFPHCDIPTQKKLLQQVYLMLVDGGVFYLEGVEPVPGAPEPAEVDRGPAGRHTVTIEEFSQWEETEGFVCTDIVKRSFGKSCPVSGWVMRLVKEKPDPFEEYTSITAEEAKTYCAGSEGQRVRDVIAERVGARKVLDWGCGPGIDAGRYRPKQYAGVDISAALIDEARRRHPDYYFTPTSSIVGWNALRSPPNCVMLKSVLEHTPSEEVATSMLKEAMQVATDEVFVAWHTPPGTLQKLRQVPGHFGKTIHQNTYLYSAFEFARPRKVERVDNFELWTIDVRKDIVLMPAGKVEDFVMIATPDYAAPFQAFYCTGGSFQNQRIWTHPARSPVGPFEGEAWTVSQMDTHTRLYKGRIDRRRRLISGIWPGLPRCGIWCFTDRFYGMEKSLVLAPEPGTLYSYAAGNPCVMGEPGNYVIYFEGCPELKVPGQPEWRIFRATWDGKNMAKVDPTPILDGANPSLLEHEGKIYLYYSRLTPGGYAAGFETCVRVIS